MNKVAVEAHYECDALLSTSRFSASLSAACMFNHTAAARQSSHVARRKEGGEVPLLLSEDENVSAAQSGHRLRL